VAGWALVEKLLLPSPAFWKQNAPYSDGKAMKRSYHDIILSPRGLKRYGAAVLLMALCAGLAAADKPSASVKKMLHRVTGVSEEDVSAARAAKELTLFDAYALSIFNTETMTIEGENSVQAALQREQAITSFLPRLSLKANKAFPEQKRNYQSLARSAVSLYARMPIVTGLDEASRIMASVSGVKLREFELYDGAGRLLADVSSAYYGVLLIRQGLANNEQVLALHERIIGELRRRVDIGRSRRSDLVRTRAQMYALEAQIKSLRSGLSHAEIGLGSITGASAGVALRDTAELPAPAYTLADEAEVMKKRWDVKAAREQVEQAKAGLMSAYGTHLPSAYIEGSYMLYQEKAKSSMLDRALDAYKLSGSSDPLSVYSSVASKTKYRDYYISLGVEMPILGSDITFAKVREAHSVKRQADLGLSKTERLARQDFLDSYKTWESSIGELDAYRKALASAEENYRLVDSDYRMNQVTILDVLTSLTSLQGARNDCERALLQSRLDRIRLGIAAGEFYGDSIRALRPAR
jgi:outer membrane protein